MNSLLTKAARKAIVALDPQSSCAKELSKINEVDNIIRQEIEKICNAATSAETTIVLILVALLKKTSGWKKEAIKSNLERIAKELVTREEKKSGRLKLPKLCRHLLLDI